MTAARAILIGVATYDDSTIPQIPAAQRDTEVLSRALSRAGYDVRLPAAGGHRLTGVELRTAIREGIQAPGADTVLVVYSGHGVHYRGMDYLVPSDAMSPARTRTESDEAEFQQRLVGLDFNAAIEESSAKTVIFMIDACREGLTFGTKSVGLHKSLVAGWGQLERQWVSTKRQAFVFSCLAGEFARITRDGTQSLFCKALCEVIDTEDRPLTLGRLATAVDDRLSDHFEAELQQERKPRVRLRGEFSPQDPPENWVLFDGAFVPAAPAAPAPTPRLNKHRVRFTGALAVDEASLRIAHRRYLQSVAGQEMHLSVEWPSAQARLQAEVEKALEQAGEGDRNAKQLFPTVDSADEFARIALDALDDIEGRRRSIEARLPLLVNGMRRYFTDDTQRRALQNFLVLADFKLSEGLAYALSGVSRAALDPVWVEVLTIARNTSSLRIQRLFGLEEPIHWAWVDRVGPLVIPGEEIVFGPRSKILSAYKASYRDEPTPTGWVGRFLIPQIELYLAMQRSTDVVDYNETVSIRKIANADFDEVDWNGNLE